MPSTNVASAAENLSRLTSLAIDSQADESSPFYERRETPIALSIFSEENPICYVDAQTTLFLSQYTVVRPDTKTFNFFGFVKCWLSSDVILEPFHHTALAGNSVGRMHNSTHGVVDAIAPVGSRLTGLQLPSESKRFTGDCQNLNGLLDVCSAGEVFKVDVFGFSNATFGPILPVGLGPEELTS